MAFKIHNLKLDTDTFKKELPRSGHGFLVRRASDDEVTIWARLVGGPADGEVLPMKIGEGFRFVPYDSIELDWSAQASGTMQIIVWGELEGVAGNEPEFYVSPTPVSVPVEAPRTM